MNLFMTGPAQGNEVVQTVFGMLLLLFVEFRLWCNVVRVEVVRGRAEEAFGEHELLIVSRDLDTRRIVFDRDTDPLSIRKGLLNKRGGQSHGFGDLDAVHVVTAAVMEPAVIPEPEVLDKEVAVLLGLDLEMAYPEALV